MDALFVMPDFLAGSEDPDPTDSTSIYIVGGEGSWSLTEPMGKMTNLGNGEYVDTLKISAPIYFVFADGGPDIWNNNWTTFNSTYRYGPTTTTTITTGTSYTTAKRNNNYSYYFTGDGSDYLFTFNAYELTFKIEVVEPQPDILLGDVNDDGLVNLGDLNLIIQFLLGQNPSVFNSANADVNQDNHINLGDMSRLIAILLNQ